MAARLAHLAQEGSRLPADPEGLGSLTRVVHELTIRLARDGPVTVYSTREPGDAAEETHDGIRHVRVFPGVDRTLVGEYFRWRNRLGRRVGLPERPYAASRAYFYSYIRRVAAGLPAAAPEIVHLHNVSQFVPPLRRAAPGARLVLQMHCDWLVELPRVVVAPRLETVDLVLGVSAHVVARVRDAFPEVAARCEVLHNGVDLDAFPPREQVAAEKRAAIAALRARHGFDGPVLLYVGRLSSEKGVHVLLDALGRIRARRPDVGCLVVGPDWGPIRRVSGPGPDALSRTLDRLDRAYMSHLRGLAAPHGDRVVFVGPVPNAALCVYHAAADVLVAPSLVEAFGIPVIEAGASGLPVVAAATGGLVDTVVPERTGLLVPAGDAGALADAVERLLADPGRGRALGRAARERVAARFTWDCVAETLAGYYERLLGGVAARRQSRPRRRIGT